jgi:hypothetical protein
MKIGDRVRYDEQNVALDDIRGTVVEPTELERAQARGPDVVFRAAPGDVMVEWDDGERFWEDPASLVVVEEADA